MTFWTRAIKFQLEAGSAPLARTGTGRRIPGPVRSYPSSASAGSESRAGEAHT
jgi:hypothetical protein